LSSALVPSAAFAQSPPAAARAPSPEVQAALKKAQAGDPAALLKLADGGDSEAQYYAGVLFIFGAKTVPKNPARGCAYEVKASARRADAMHLVGMCYQTGGGGTLDKAKAEAAYAQAAKMGFPKSKCALGKMLMAEPSRAERGLALCKEAATAGDVDAQVAVGDAYFSGTVIKRNPSAARIWYEMAAKQKNPQASRRLGEMHANGIGGAKDTKKAMALWVAGEKAGDPMVAILVADQLFLELSGGRKPGPGTYAFRGGVPASDIAIAEEWYRLAETRDPRPDVKQRANYALKILAGLRGGSAAASSKPPRR
jgi:uncharacterized protein